MDSLSSLQDRLKAGKGVEVTISGKSLIIVPSPLFNEAAPLRVLVSYEGSGSLLWGGGDIDIFDLVCEGFPLRVSGVIIELLEAIFTIPKVAYIPEHERVLALEDKPKTKAKKTYETRKNKQPTKPGGSRRATGKTKRKRKGTVPPERDGNLRGSKTRKAGSRPAA